MEDFINDNIKMIYKIANVFYNVPKEDLYQAGILGLLKAKKNYKENTDAKFSSYAYDYIYGEMYNLACNKKMKINRDYIKLYHLIEKTKDMLSQKLERIPSNSEIAKFLEIDEEKINMAMMSAKEIMSLDDDEIIPYYEVIKANEKINIDDKILLNDCLDTLSKDEKNIIKSRYYDDLTQSETAKKLHLTQVMVSRYEKRSLSKMQEYLLK